MKRLFKNPLTYYAAALLFLAFTFARQARADLVSATVVICSPCALTGKPLASHKVIVGPRSRGSGRYDWSQLSVDAIQVLGQLDPDDLVAVCLNNTSDMAVCDKGLERVKNVFVATAAPPPPPPISFLFTGYPVKPSIKDGSFVIEKTDTEAAVVWAYEAPIGIARAFYCFNPAKVPNGAWQWFVASLAAVLERSVNRPCTDAEMALVEKAWARVVPTVTVSAIASGTRPIYAMTANVRGADTGKRAKVGDPCGLTRIPNTSYYAVPGGFTLCTVTGYVNK